MKKIFKILCILSMSLFGGTAINISVALLRINIFHRNENPFNFAWYEIADISAYAAMLFIMIILAPKAFRNYERSC